MIFNTRARKRTELHMNLSDKTAYKIQLNTNFPKYVLARIRPPRKLDASINLSLMDKLCTGNYDLLLMCFSFGCHLTSRTIRKQTRGKIVKEQLEATINVLSNSIHNMGFYMIQFLMSKKVQSHSELREKRHSGTNSLV